MLYRFIYLIVISLINVHPSFFSLSLIPILIPGWLSFGWLEDPAGNGNSFRTGNADVSDSTALSGSDGADSILNHCFFFLDEQR